MRETISVRICAVGTRRPAGWRRPGRRRGCRPEGFLTSCATTAAISPSFASAACSAQPPFHLHAIGQVVKDAGELPLAVDRHLRRPTGAAGKVEPSFRRPWTSRPLPMIFARPGGQVARQVGVVFLAIGRGHQHVDVVAADFGGGVAEQPFGAGIEGLDPSVRVDHDDPVHR